MLTLGAFAGHRRAGPAGTPAGQLLPACSSPTISPRFAKLLILAGGALIAVLALDFNAGQRIARFEFPC